MIEQLTSEFQERVTRLLLDGCGTAGGAGIVTNSNQQQPQQAAALPVAGLKTKFYE
jgi:hypothetical protein